MKKLLILLALSFSVSFSQLRETVKFNNGMFWGEYSEVKEQPLWVEYKIYKPHSNSSREGMDFYKDDIIKTSDNEDYKGNEWDKGHLAPAATFGETELRMRATFTYLNSALQHQDLNRGEWRFLEDAERDWAQEETLTVRIVVEFKKKATKLTSGATIPHGFHRHIYFHKKKSKECYFFLNEKPSKKWKEYKIKCK
jgi:DNA/RNA endonuclease G (NUC1)